MPKGETRWNVISLAMSAFVFSVLVVVMLPDASGTAELGLLLMGGAILLVCMTILVAKLILEGETNED